MTHFCLLLSRDREWVLIWSPSKCVAESENCTLNGRNLFIEPPSNLLTYLKLRFKELCALEFPPAPGPLCNNA